MAVANDNEQMTVVCGFNLIAQTDSGDEDDSALPLELLAAICCEGESSRYAT